MVRNRTGVWVMQHPREHLHPIGTARFAELGLENSHALVAWNAAEREPNPPAWLPSKVGLLYPSEHARDLRGIATHELPRHLLVLDGTWHTAHTLYRNKSWLHALPHFRFLPATAGRYRLRKEPQLDYVSTIEAIVEALRILEPDTTGLDELLLAFDSMIDDQLAYVARSDGPRRVRKRRRPEAERRTPRALVEDFERLIMVYGEPSRPQDSREREFLYFTAFHLGSGARFERVMRPRQGAIDAMHLTHMGIDAARFEHGIETTEFVRDWKCFVAETGARSQIAAWNQRTLDLLAHVSETPASRLSIKGAYRVRFGSALQGLNAVLAEHALVLPEHTGSARAEQRLAGAVVVARFLNAMARGASHA
jgi:DTW domain-containing protein YfiP